MLTHHILYVPLLQPRNALRMLQHLWLPGASREDNTPSPAEQPARAASRSMRVAPIRLRRREFRRTGRLKHPGPVLHSRSRRRHPRNACARSRRTASLHAGPAPPPPGGHHDPTPPRRPCGLPRARDPARRIGVNDPVRQRISSIGVTPRIPSPAAITTCVARTSASRARDSSGASARTKRSSGSILP